MSTPLFPTTISHAYPYEVRSSWNTLISQLGVGMEVRHQRQVFPRREIVPHFSWLDPTDLNSIWQFYQARKGSLESFHFYAPIIEQWYGEYVGLGEGIAIITFDLPSMNTDDATLAVYKNGILQVGEATDYAFSEGTGENGADQIVFATGPDLYDVITADFEGQHRFLCRFQSDNLSRSLISMLCYNAEFALQEVLDLEYGGVFTLKSGGLFELEE